MSDRRQTHISTYSKNSKSYFVEFMWSKRFVNTNITYHINSFTIWNEPDDIFWFTRQKISSLNCVISIFTGLRTMYKLTIRIWYSRVWPKMIYYIYIKKTSSSFLDVIAVSVCLQRCNYTYLTSAARDTRASNIELSGVRQLRFVNDLSSYQRKEGASIAKLKKLMKQLWRKRRGRNARKTIN